MIVVLMVGLVVLVAFALVVADCYLVFADYGGGLAYGTGLIVVI